MTTFFADKSKSDSNAGTSEATAFRTIAKALSVMQAGDRLLIREGIWSERISTSSQKVPSGTSWSNPVTIAAYPNETVTLRPLSGYSAIDITGNVSQYIIFDRLIIDSTHMSNVGIRLAGTRGHIRFTNCEAYGSPDNLFLLVRGSNYNEILNCEIHHNVEANVGTRPDGHGIYMESSNNLVAGCTFHHCTGYGVHVYTGHTGYTANNNVIRNNIAYENSTVASSSAGILIGSGSGNIAYNNICYGQPVGIMIGQPKSANNKIYNNTVYNNSLDGIQIRASALTTTVKNNIAYNNGTDIHDFSTSTIKSNNYTSNPNFVNAGAGDFHLQSGSGAINAGATLSEVPTDFENRIRPSGTSYDIGAYEFGGTPAPIPPTSIPTAPASPFVTVLSSSQLRIAWTDNSNNESGFEVWRSLTGSGGWARRVTTGANITSYTDSGLTAGVTYYYQMRAVNIAGTSAYTVIASGTTAGAPGAAPAAPSDLQATALSATSIELTWTRNATTETAVEIERAVSPFTSFTPIISRPATTIAYTDTGRAPSTEYAYRVRNVNSVGPSAYSNTDNATTPAAPGSVPNAPTNLTVEVISYRQSDLAWTNTGGDEDGFRIFRSDDALSFSQVATVDAGITYYSDLALAENTTYWWRVVSYNEAGESTASNITNATTPPLRDDALDENQLRSLFGLYPLPNDDPDTEAHWRQLFGLYRGPFDVPMFILFPPDPGTGIITLLDIHTTADTYLYASFEPTSGANAYHGRILANASITKEQPDHYNGIPGRREAQLELSNININPEAPTLSEIEFAQDPIGLYAPVRLYDMNDGRDLFRLDGKITSYQPGIATASVTIAIDEPKIFESPLPKVRTAPLFPNLDLSTVRIQDPVVHVVFGPWRKVPLVLCDTNNLTYWRYGAIRKASVGTVSIVNVYRDGALVGPDEYTIVEAVAGILCVQFALDQTNRGQPLPIVADLTSTEFSQNPAHVIRFLLSHVTYGLGQTVDDTSFDLAAIDYALIPMRVGGGLSEQQEARVILRDLLLHGAFLDRDITGAYTLTVDTLALHPQHQDSNFQLGFGQQDWDNIPNDPSATVRDESTRLKELAIDSGWDPYFMGNGSYHIHVKEERAIAGATKKLQNKFLFDATTTDRQRHYLWIRTNARDKQFPVDSIVESYVLDVGHLVKTTIPTMKLDHVVMEVVRRTSQGGTDLAFSYLLTPWDAQAYSYVPGTIEQDRYADVLLDYRRTPPETPTNFRINGATRRGEASLFESVAVLAVDRVFFNITHVKFISYRTGSAVPLQEIEVRAPASEIGGDPTVTGSLTLHPGLGYDFEYFAINKENDADRQESARGFYSNFTAPGDIIPPAPPTHLFAKRGSLRTVFLTWEATVDHEKLKEYVVERTTDPTWATSTDVAHVKTTNYTDTDTPYDSTLYYRVKAVSRSGLSSLWSNVAVMVVVRALPSDYGRDSQYRYHRAPLSQVVFIVTVPANSAFAFTTGIDAKKYEWQAGMLGEQATSSWNGTTPGVGTVIDGTRLMSFQAGGGVTGPFSVDFDCGVWNGTAEELVTVIQASGS